MHVNDADATELLPQEVQAEPMPVTPDEEQVRRDPSTLPGRSAGVLREQRLRRLWTVGSVLSIGLNIFLCLGLLIAANQLFTIKKLIGADLLGGLLVNFVSMDQAHIQTTVQVHNVLPVKFELPISQDTQVTTTQPTYISGATVASLSTGGLVIRNAPADIVLPAGTPLQVHLEMTVPVDTQIPVTLTVPVDIAIDQTELHAPLVGLKQALMPYYWLLRPEWPSCQDVPFFSRFGSACTLFFRGP